MRRPLHTTLLLSTLALCLAAAPACSRGGDEGDDDEVSEVSLAEAPAAAPAEPEPPRPARPIPTATDDELACQSSSDCSAVVTGCCEWTPGNNDYAARHRFPACRRDCGRYPLPLCRGGRCTLAFRETRR